MPYWNYILVEDEYHILFSFIIYSGLFSDCTDGYFHCRHAALMALSAVGEGCHKQMEAMLPQIMDGVLSFLQDPVSMCKVCTTVA